MTKLADNKWVILGIFWVVFFFSFYFDFEFNGFLFLFISMVLVDRLQDFKVDINKIWIFSWALGFICVSWIFFIVKYVGIFWVLCAVFLSSLVLGILFFLMFLPFVFFDKIVNLKLKIIFAVLYSVYFSGWNYLFFMMDDLGLSFLQFYFVASKLYLFYPLFEIHPSLVNFFISLLVLLVDYRKIGFWILLAIFNFILKYYYQTLALSSLEEFMDKLRKYDLKLYFISANTVIDSLDYRIRNENLVFYKLAVALSLNFKNSIFFLPEGSLSKNERYLFYTIKPNLSPAVYNISSNLKTLLGNYNLFLDSMYIFFNPTVVDYENKRIFNSVVLLNLKEVWENNIKEFQVYDKVFLVPFTERVPQFFRPFSKILSKWIVIFKYLDYSNGKDDNKVFFVKNLKFKPLICFESFKYLYLNREYGDFIVVSANDSWFRSNPMLYLHLKSVKMLSVSKKKIVVFIANGYKNKIFVFDDITGFVKNVQNLVFF